MTSTTRSPDPTRDGTLHLDGVVGRSTADLTGTWSPSTTDLSEELPPLITELHELGARIFRIAYNPSRWDPASRKLQADGRTVHLGAFHTLEPDLLILTGSAGERVDLAVPARPVTRSSHAPES